jgi:hypothetical protein
VRFNADTSAPSEVSRRSKPNTSTHEHIKGLGRKLVVMKRNDGGVSVAQMGKVRGVPS